MDDPNAPNPTNPNAQDEFVDAVQSLVLNTWSSTSSSGLPEYSGLK